MSVILAVKTKDQIIFGADRRMTFAYQAYDNSQKIHQIGKRCIVGICGLGSNEFELLSYLRESKITSERRTLEAKDIYEYFKDMNDSRTVNWTEEDDILLGINDQIFHIYPYKLTIYEVNEFEAIGSGANYALGSYYTSTTIPLKGKIYDTYKFQQNLVKLAIITACKFHIECGGEADVLSYVYGK